MQVIRIWLLEFGYVCLFLAMRSIASLLFFNLSLAQCYALHGFFSSSLAFFRSFINFFNAAEKLGLKRRLHCNISVHQTKMTLMRPVLARLAYFCVRSVPTYKVGIIEKSILKDHCCIKALYAIFAKCGFFQLILAY